MVWKLFSAIVLAGGLMLTTPITRGAETQATYVALTSAEKPLDRAALRGFADVFEDFGSSDLAKKIERAYAETFYFNDTLVTLTERDALIDYLLETHEKTNYVRARIVDVARSGDDVYVRWQMEISFNAMGRERTSDTVGMTHLRFDSNGQIILHQDFWDSATGFYQTLPVLGRLISWVRNGLAP
jgi:predicted SnoaL-like aldol condensation-catalyzing enzyme